MFTNLTRKNSDLESKVPNPNSNHPLSFAIADDEFADLCFDYGLELDEVVS